MELVSAIVTTSNRAHLVVRAVRSVLDQTFEHLECLVIDDGSTDETPALLAGLAATDTRIRLFRHERSQGPSAARNTGIAAARGRYLAFLDDDDYWLPGKVERQVALLDDSPPSVGLVYCWFDYRIGEKIVRGRSPKLEGRIFGHLLERQPLGNSSTLLVPRAVAAAVGGFDVDLPRGNDGDFIRRVGLHYEICYVPEVLVHVDVGHGLPRLTAFDRKGASEALAADHAKLRKFAAELQGLPRQRAAIYGSIGFHHSLLGEWREACWWFWRAVSSQPFYPGAYRPLLRSGKALMLRVLHRRCPAPA